MERSDESSPATRSASGPVGVLIQIGAVAERIGLSLRTIRHYEEVGVVVPAERSPGGFRLYSEDNVAELRLVKQMKPLEFSLEQTRELLETVRALRTDDGADRARTAALQERLAMYRSVVDARVGALREQLYRTEDFAGLLRSPDLLRPVRNPH